VQEAIEVRQFIAGGIAGRGHCRERASHVRSREAATAEVAISLVVDIGRGALLRATKTAVAAGPHQEPLAISAMLEWLPLSSRRMVCRLARDADVLRYCRSYPLRE
jgi:hypothetical protein